MIYLVEDDSSIRGLVEYTLNNSGLPTKGFESAEPFWAAMKEELPSLILLDINLGDGSGFELCKHIRSTLNIPILFVSARNTDDDKIIALNIGGDDYVEKPYSLGVLLAKVKVMLRRFGSVSEKETSDTFEDGSLLIDKKNKLVTLDGEPKKLTSMEFTLLLYLVENPDRLITKAELFDNVWKDKFTSDGTLNVHIRKLREAIEEDPKNPLRIQTVWKEGYKYVTGAGR